MNRHIYIEAVAPIVDHGLYPVKRVVGDPLEVTADIFRDGHEMIAAQLRCKSARDEKWQVYPMVHVDNDRFSALAPLRHNTEVCFCVDAWTDVFATWLHELSKKVEAGLDVPSEVAEGGALLATAAAAAEDAAHQSLLRAAHKALLAAAKQPRLALAVVSTSQIHDLMHRCMPRLDLLTSAEYRVTVDRPRALYSTWYEFFPRSQGTVPGQPSSLREAEGRLADIAGMGFDVVYLPPIHPIGVAHRKGPNNSLTPGPHDPGCPWAIGNKAGGHTAIDPALGTHADFGHFVEAAKAHNIEVALDFAVQCSPDHPWVTEHPEWFYHRPDGTIKYAENPPKKYQDVYPVNFDTADKQALWQALRDVMLFWVARGVKIFRVDNPHTKPFEFWAWAIAQVHESHPEVIFLAEAFTRPKVMKSLAKLGFTQSYTYFTWRNTPAEMSEYLQELCHSGMQDYYRPNFFANTPDILPEVLQTGGPAAFKMRAILAATLSPTYGIYSGFELCENAALAGREEYLNSEKYEVRVRNWQAPGHIKDLLRALNALRAAHTALQRLDNIAFLDCDNPNILAYNKHDEADTLLIAVNMDPHNAHHATVTVPPESLGLPLGARYEVTDLLSGAVYNWGEQNFVRLVPNDMPAHILQVGRRLA